MTLINTTKSMCTCICLSVSISTLRERFILFLLRIPQHYEHVMLPVWMCNCEQPDDYGVAQYCVPALVYIAQDKYTHKGTKVNSITRNMY